MVIGSDKIRALFLYVCINSELAKAQFEGDSMDGITAAIQSADARAVGHAIFFLAALVLAMPVMLSAKSSDRLVNRVIYGIWMIFIGGAVVQLIWASYAFYWKFDHPHYPMYSMFPAIGAVLLTCIGVCLPKLCMQGQKERKEERSR